MIKVVIKNDIIKISGHANFDNYGNDIVCASVSSIVLTTINGILNLNNKAISYKDEQDLEIKILEKDKTTIVLINNMIELLDDLARQYPKNIMISKGE